MVEVREVAAELLRAALEPASSSVEEFEGIHNFFTDVSALRWVCIFALLQYTCGAAGA